MKKAVVGVVVALAALAVAPGAGARATYETDVFIADVDFLKSGDVLVSGALFAEKGKCERNREVKLYNVQITKRRGAQEPLDTATTSNGGAFGLIASEEDIGPGVRVKAPEATKGDDTCAKGSDVVFFG
jgi:hypothetical protein